MQRVYNTPGFLLLAKSFLDKNANPTEPKQTNARRQHLSVAAELIHGI